MTLEQLMAFTVTNDHARQEQVWESLARAYNKEPYYLQGPDPGQKQDPAKVRTYAPTPFKFSRYWCRGSALKPPLGRREQVRVTLKPRRESPLSIADSRRRG